MAGTEHTETPGGRRVWIGLAALAFAALAFGWLWMRSSVPSGSTPAAKAAPEAGIVDLRAAVRSHSAYPSLVRLREERNLLAAEAEAARKKLLSMTAPKAAREPFADAAEQKARQEMFRERAVLLEKLEEAERLKREETKAGFEAAREEINAAYFNDIFNTQLKLDNADLMRLSKEKVADLKTHLENLQRERSRRQIALREQYEEEMREYKEALAAQHGTSLKALEDEAHGRLLAEEMRRRSEAQARNLDTLQKNLLDSAELRMELQQKQSAIRSKSREIEAMENAILRELAEETRKLAETHGLSVVYAASVRERDFLAPKSFTEEPLPFPARVIGVSALDLTEELIHGAP